jgi:hypothetical protein
VAPSTISSVEVNQGDLLQEMKTMQNFLNERFDQQQERLDEQHERFQQELFNEQQERFGRFDRVLEDENLVFEMKPDKDKKAFWSEEIQNQVNAIYMIIFQVR